MKTPHIATTVTQCASLAAIARYILIIYIIGLSENFPSRLLFFCKNALHWSFEQSARKFRNLPLQAKERTWVNCKLITAWHQNSEPGSLQCECHTGKKCNQLIRNKRLTSAFLNNFGPNWLEWWCTILLVARSRKPIKYMLESLFRRC